jgi:cupin 2 domain-containing protein
MWMKANNLFLNIKEMISGEIFEALLKNEYLKLERIISDGHATSQGEWYDQDTNEWVILLQGSAGILFEGDTEVLVLQPGDYLNIPAHMKHRVEWTDPGEKTIWLALHYL